MKSILPNYEPIEMPESQNEEILKPQSDLEIKDLSFGYHEKLILKDINMKIPLHKMTALVGRTGSGKSTLVQILMGLYTNYNGEINWDSYQFKKSHPLLMTKLVGQVNQELFFFEDTLRENLRLFDQNINDSDIFFWLDRFEMSEKIKSHPLALEMKIDKNEMPFSQGEKQLFILIRLLLKKPALLIFDEATAHLDQLAEIKIMKAMEHILKDHTVIMVAHRLASLNLAEQIFVMKDGRIDKSFSKLKGKPVHLSDLSSH
jgi:ABC-type bacteriocin/lantibiotic exporter with double-glycine peptidase domain